MPIKRSGPGVEPAFQRWDGGLTWIAHPDEAMARASHAIAVDADGRLADGDHEPGEVDVWVVEPVDARGLDEWLTELGRVTGVVVLSGYHRRHAAAVASRHDVPVYVPSLLAAAGLVVDTTVEAFDDTLPGTRFELVAVRSWPAWREAALYDPNSKTLVAAESLVSQDAGTGPGERLAMAPYVRLWPPREAFAGLVPERVLVGHGDPVLEDATEALEAALADAYRGFPAYLAANPRYFLRAWAVALWR